MPRPLHTAIALIGVAALGAAAWFAWRPAVDASPSAPSAVVHPQPAGVTSPPTRAADRPPAPAAVSATAADYEARIRADEDLLPFAESLRDAANHGDGPARYYLYKIMLRCGPLYLAFFDGVSREHSVDEALVANSSDYVHDREYIAALHRQCDRFHASDRNSFGTAEEWLEAAAAAGYPEAQAVFANELARLAKHGKSPKQAHDRERAEQLANQALRSKDPGALYELKFLATYLEGRDVSPGVEEYAWHLAACARGYDCGPQTEETQMACRNDPACQPYESLVDILMRASPELFAPADRRAREINELLDAGRFEELHFEITGSDE